MKMISNHISYEEAIRSDIAKRNGINNYFTPEQLGRMILTANKIFEPLRDHYGVSIFIPSFFRNAKINELAGGVPASQHLANDGSAIDIDADVFGGVTNRQLFCYIRDNLVFDQLIDEGIGEDGTGGWVHASYNEKGNRGEIWVMKIIDGEKTYEKYVA